MAKYCFGAVFVEAVFLFGVFPYMAVLLRTEGVVRSSIAGVVISGFGIGGVIYTFMVAWLLAHVGERRLMAAGGTIMGLCLIVIALRMSWPIEFLNFMALGFGFYLLHGCIQVYVTELAPAARGSATAAHSFFFFLGQAAGPVVYGVGLASVGVSAVLLIGAAALAATGWICALQMRKPEAAS
jgi:predicted MFS family arabinose efflux permease